MVVEAKWDVDSRLRLGSWLSKLEDSLRLFCSGEDQPTNSSVVGDSARITVDERGKRKEGMGCSKHIFAHQPQ